MYASKMKRLQIMIEEDIDDALERQAREEGTSKAALIRRYVGERLRPAPAVQDDPVWGLVGMCPEIGAVDDIDEVVYG